MSWDPAAIFGSALTERLVVSDVTTNASGTAVANGDTVSTWPARTGTNATQSTAAAQPTYVSNAGSTAKPGLSFDGTDDYMQVSVATALLNATDATIYVVVMDTGGGRVLSGAPAPTNADYQTSNAFDVSHNSGVLSIEGGNSTNSYQHANAPVDSNPHIYVFQRTSTGLSAWRDGTAGTTASATMVALNVLSLLIGASSSSAAFGAFTILEAGLVNANATATQRSQLDSYAQDTYAGITVSDYVTSGGGSASVSDSIPLATGVTRSQSQARTVTDTLAASTSASSIQGQQKRSIADSLGLTTLVSRVASAVRSIADTLGLTSSATGQQTHARTVADGVPLSTSVSTSQATQTRATADSISLSTSVAVSFTPASAPRNLVIRVGQPTPRFKVGEPTPRWAVGVARPRWKVSEPN